MNADLKQFIPKQPENSIDLKIDFEIITNLVMKELYIYGKKSPRQIAKSLKVHVDIIQKAINDLKQSEFVGMVGGSGIGSDYLYGLYPKGTERAKAILERDPYLGVAPVSFEEYVKVTKAILEHNKKKATINKSSIEAAFKDTLGYKDILIQLGQAICARKPVFVYGFPGNGKTYLCSNVVKLLPPVAVPYTVVVAGQLIRIFDPSCHIPLENFDMEGLDERWIVIKAPLIVTGGELELENLEVVFNKKYNCFDAPPQVKACGGVLLIDDLGRQRCSVEDIFNRFIIPLENKVDYLVMGGQRMEVPVDEIVLFSTNLEPKQIVDDAFLRRVPYKINVRNPTKEEYQQLWKFYADKLGLKYDSEIITNLFELYKKDKRGLRAVHPRDLLSIIYDRKRFLEIESTTISNEELLEAYKLYFVSEINLVDEVI